MMPLLILSTRGTSGIPRFTPLEYRRHGRNLYVLATGPGARWLKRVYQDELVAVRIGVRCIPASAAVVTDEAEAARALFLFRMNAPVPLRWIYWSGRNQAGIRPRLLRETARKYTFVRLEMLPGRATAVPPVPADRAWMLAIGLAIIAAIVIWLRKSRV
jgi:hypothetical protein